MTGWLAGGCRRLGLTAGQAWTAALGLTLATVLLGTSLPPVLAQRRALSGAPAGASPGSALGDAGSGPAGAAGSGPADAAGSGPAGAAGAGAGAPTGSPGPPPPGYGGGSTPVPASLDSALGVPGDSVPNAAPPTRSSTSPEPGTSGRPPGSGRPSGSGRPPRSGRPAGSRYAAPSPAATDPAGASPLVVRAGGYASTDPEPAADAGGDPTGLPVSVRAGSPVDTSYVRLSGTATVLRLRLSTAPGAQLSAQDAVVQACRLLTSTWRPGRPQPPVPRSGSDCVPGRRQPDGSYAFDLAAYPDRAGPAGFALVADLSDSPPPGASTYRITFAGSRTA